MACLPWKYDLSHICVCVRERLGEKGRVQYVGWYAWNNQASDPLMSAHHPLARYLLEEFFPRVLIRLLLFQLALLGTWKTIHYVFNFVVFITNLFCSLTRQIRLTWVAAAGRSPPYRCLPLWLPPPAAASVVYTPPLSCRGRPTPLSCQGRPTPITTSHSPYGTWPTKGSTLNEHRGRSHRGLGIPPAGDADGDTMTGLLIWKSRRWKISPSEDEWLTRWKTRN